MNYTIRKMDKKDISGVQQVAKTSWHHTYAGIIPFDIQENFFNMAYNDERLQRRLELSHMFVAVSEGEIVGFANYSPLKEDATAELSAIYLYPEYQGFGIGTSLLHEGIKLLNGVKEIYINVERDNKSGRDFYHAKGFTIVSEFDDNFDGHILKTVRMVLKVSS